MNFANRYYETRNQSQTLENGRLAEITESHFSRKLLKPIAGRSEQLVSLITDKDGLAIAANRSIATEEIDRVNLSSGNAVLYYRTSQGLKSLGNQKAVSSSNGLFNEAGENALSCAEKNANAEVWHLNVKVGKRHTRQLW